MDKRNSKDQMLAEIDRLNRKIEAVFQTGLDGIYYVGSANYADREAKAVRDLELVMYGQD